MQYHKNYDNYVFLLLHVLDLQYYEQDHLLENEAHPMVQINGL